MIRSSQYVVTAIICLLGALKIFYGTTQQHDHNTSHLHEVRAKAYLQDHAGLSALWHHLKSGRETAKLNAIPKSASEQKIATGSFDGSRSSVAQLESRLKSAFTKNQSTANPGDEGWDGEPHAAGSMGEAELRSESAPHTYQIQYFRSGLEAVGFRLAHQEPALNSPVEGLDTKCC
eukprot:1191092-Prorocentrum_minimum.AAC.4